MPKLIACPDPVVLKDLLHSQKSSEELAAFAEHLEDCGHCAETVDSFLADDLLLKAMQAQRLVPDLHGGPAVQALIQQFLHQHHPEQSTLNPVTSSSNASNTGQDGLAAVPTNYEFLSPAQGPDELGRLGPYRVLRVLGHGGMGMVFQAEDLHLQRQVALKVMLPEMAARPTSRERFLREARAAANIEHEHIVTIFQVGEEGGVPFLAMQWLKGMSLEERLQRPQPLSVAQVLRLGQQIARGLAASHERGLIHRDIKPGNLWIEPEHGGRIKILDFGLARPVQDDAHLTQSGAIVGTPSYMAPEQARGEKIDAHCDLFSLGVVLYRMCTGQLPFRGTNTLAVLTALATETPAHVSSLNLELPIPLADLVMQLLAKNPEKRPASAREVADRLKALERHQPAVTLSQTVEYCPAVATPASGWKRHLLTAAAVLATALLSLGFFFGAQIVRFANNKSALVIQVDDPKVQVVVKQNGVVVQDKTTLREFELTPVDGEIEVYEAASGLKLLTKKFALTRGGKEYVNITAEVAQAQKKKPEEKKNGKPLEKPTPSDPDRMAAEWVLSISGTICFMENGKSRQIKAVGDLPLGTFELTVVNLTRNQQVSDAGLAHFKNCRNLTELELGYTQASDAGLAHFKDCKNLTILKLGGTQMKGPGLAHFKDCKKLTVLYLGGLYSNTQVGDSGLAHFKDCENLTKLFLYNTQVGDAGLVHLKKLTNLTLLNLSSTRVSDAGLEHLKPLTKLSTLNLKGTKVANSGLTHLKAMTDLNSLDLDRTHVNDSGLLHLKTLTSLTSLRLKGTQVSDAGLIHLKTLTSLDSLRLENTRVTDAGIEHLKTLKGLRTISLEYTQLSDAGLVHLINLANLEEIKLKATRVSVKGFATLKAAFPKAAIDWSEPNRTAAEAVLALQGSVHVRSKGDTEDYPVKVATDLPTEYFQLTRVSLRGFKNSLTSMLTKLVVLADPEFDRLTDLDLSDTRVSDNDLERLKPLTNLRRLVLDGAPIKGTGLVHLKALPALTELRVGCFTLTDLGVGNLAELKQLERLLLAGSDVSDAELKSLRGLTRLQELNLTGTQVTAAGIADLQKALPKCKIVGTPGKK